MSNAKQQHIIPRLHLQHFAGDAPPGHVWTYDALNRRRWSAVPEETATEGHFYSGERSDGTMDPALEELLARIEDRAAPTYEAILEGKIPGPSRERANFAHFMGLMYSRTRIMRRMAATGCGQFMQIMSYAYASNPDAFNTVVGDYEKKTGRVLSEEEKRNVQKAMLDPTGYEFTVSKEAGFFAIGVADDLAPIFFDMHWWVLTAAEGYFITSDNPVVREVDPKTQESFYGDGGFLNKTAEVTFPLSPTKLLLMTWREVEYKKVIQRDTVFHANEARAVHADQYLHAHVNDDAVARLAEQYRDVRPGMKISGFGPQKFAEVKVERRSASVPKGSPARAKGQNPSSDKK